MNSSASVMSEAPEESEISAFCPRFHHAVELVGRRWTGAILRAMFAGRVRFTDIAACIPGISDRLLSERLKELEVEGVVDRLVFPETPVRIEYHLTEKGRALEPSVTEISTWAEAWT
ncbi:MAG: winged helix-turn-helix transcriptional regulator [Tepidiformaceae bacterium]